MNNNFDLIVIGAGSGGLAAAKRAASYGAKVGIIEGSEIGGTCVIRGCVPKKLMVYAANNKLSLINSKGYGLNSSEVNFSSNTLLRNIRNEVLRLSEIHTKSLEKLNIKVYKGWGRFISLNEIEILNTDKKQIRDKVSGEKILISVGGIPNKLNFPGSHLAWNSDDVFKLEKFPKSILIIGGGYIACEFACIFRNLGIEVTQVIRSNNLLNGFDKDLALFLKQKMISSGINLKFNEEVLAIKESNLGLQISLQSGLNENKESVLIATGRKPNVDNLNLKPIGIDKCGKYIKVGNLNQTNIANIFAIGDVIDKPNLTPVAIEQGRVFADNFFGNLNRVVNYKNIPKAVFTVPELASVGLTEEEAKEIYSETNVSVFKSNFTPMSNTFKIEKSKSMLKLIVHKLDDKILGCHMFGESASEIIQLASVALNAGATKRIFDQTMALHPTVAEEFVTMY